MSGMYETICCNCMNETGGQDPCPECGAPLIFKNEEEQVLQPRTMLCNGLYLIGKCLGKGGFGVTYLGLDVNLRIPVAIKEFFPNKFATRATDRTEVVVLNTKEHRDNYEYTLAKFIEEARTLANFNHRNIVPISLCFEENNTAYLVMRYIPGKTLERELQELKGNISEERLLQIMGHVLKGLKAVHDQGILHMDIKPQNIFLSDEGYALLLDFGAAREAAKISSSLIFFTDGYAPVEQYPSSDTKNTKKGPWSDVYACAATMYSCFKGEFDKNSHLVPPPSAVDRLSGKRPADPIQKISKSKLSPHVAAAVMRGLESDPKRRPQSIDEFQNLITPAPPSKLELLVLSGDEEYQGHRIPLSAKPLIIGKDRSCDLVFSHNMISRKHCQVQLIDGAVHVRDLDSSNGTSLNYEPCMQAQAHVGDVISLGRQAEFTVVEKETPGAGTIADDPAYRHTDAPLLDLQYAGFFRKLGAFILDTMIAFAASLFLFLWAVEPLISSGPKENGVFIIVFFSISVFYGALMEWSAQHATPGKMALDSMVSDIAGRSLSLSRALLRNLCRALPLLILSILLVCGTIENRYFWQFFFLTLGLVAVIETVPLNSKKQALCERIAACLTLKKQG